MNCAQRGCPPLRPDSAACHCAACHQTFSNLTLFDSHQEWEKGYSRLSCKAGSALGLVLASGAWWTPEGLQASTERVARMRAKVAA